MILGILERLSTQVEEEDSSEDILWLKNNLEPWSTIQVEKNNPRTTKKL